MLNKLVDAANQNENLLQDVTVISTQLQKGSLNYKTEALQQSISKVLNEVKTVKAIQNLKTFSLCATVKTAQQINSQNVVEQNRNSSSKTDYTRSNQSN